MCCAGIPLELTLHVNGERRCEQRWRGRGGIRGVVRAGVGVRERERERKRRGVKRERGGEDERVSGGRVEGDRGREGKDEGVKEGERED